VGRALVREVSGSRHLDGGRSGVVGPLLSLRQARAPRRQAGAVSVELLHSLVWREGKQRQHSGLAGQSHNHSNCMYQKGSTLRLGPFNERSRPSVMLWNMWGSSDPPKFPRLWQLRQRPYAERFSAQEPTSPCSFMRTYRRGQWVVPTRRNTACFDRVFYGCLLSA